MLQKVYCALFSGGVFQPSTIERGQNILVPRIDRSVEVDKGLDGFRELIKCCDMQRRFPSATAACDGGAEPHKGLDGRRMPAPRSVVKRGRKVVTSRLGQRAKADENLDGRHLPTVGSLVKWRPAQLAPCPHVQAKSNEELDGRRAAVGGSPMKRSALVRGRGADLGAGVDEKLQGGFAARRA